LHILDISTHESCMSSAVKFSHRFIGNSLVGSNYGSLIMRSDTLV